jgi:hypothetical protein
MVIRMTLMYALLVAGMLSLSGCGQPTDSPPAASQPQTDVAGLPETAVTPAMADALARADALDGQSDNVVSLCASCALGMDGSAAHPLRVGQYTMHFCKADCKQSFGEDISKSVLAMEVPDADSGDAH